jgi:hypothetical protein
VIAGAVVLMILVSSLYAGVEHSGWRELLKATVNEEGWVDYRQIRDEYESALNDYIDKLGRVDVNELKGDDEKKAFWINAYNALTIRTLLDEDLPGTVPHAAFFGKNIFKQEDYRIAGKVRSLNEIEHEILRKRFDDPRIHAALVCGASSCPRLRPEPYTGAGIDRQLNEEVRRWLQKGRNKAGRRKNRLDTEANILYVSEIFKWFEEDFDGGGEEGVLAFVYRYVDEETREYMKRHDVKIEHLDYDWSLNNQEEGSNTEKKGRK